MLIRDQINVERWCVRPEFWIKQTTNQMSLNEIWHDIEGAKMR